MIELGNPRRGVVTTVAGFDCLYVTRAFTGGNNIIVTILAQAQYFDMIHQHHGLPAKVIMASLTGITRVYVIQSFTRRLRAIVTADTGLTDDRIMVEKH